VSLSSTDYVGHSFGPNSVEAEDTYLRLDRDLADFFNFVDKEIGKGQWLFFISADHGVAHVPGFLKENKLPGGTFNDRPHKKALNEILEKKFGHANLVLNFNNYQVHTDRHLIDSVGLDRDAVIDVIVKYCQKLPEVARAFDLSELNETTLPVKIKNMIENGYNPDRGGDVQIILQPQYFGGGATGTTHGQWYPYDAHIPLVWYGWNIKPGRSAKEVYMTDVAPTIAALLRIQMPNGTVGKVIDTICP